jgi:hypothetical protein
MDYLNQILVNQYGAALAMLKQCVAACPVQHWEGKLARMTVRQIAYHALFFVDLYLSREKDFALRDLNERGGDERVLRVFSPGLSKDETLAYLEICQRKMLDTIASESEQLLRGESGFSYRKFSRGELHIYNIRHIQHHAA